MLPSTGGTTFLEWVSFIPLFQLLVRLSSYPPVAPPLHGPMFHNIMDRTRCGHLRTRSESNPFEYDSWACVDTMALYQFYFPHRSIRWCFFNVHPNMEHNIFLLNEFEDPTGLSLLPSLIYHPSVVMYHLSATDRGPVTAMDSALDGENQ